MCGVSCIFFNKSKQKSIYEMFLAAKCSGNNMIKYGP